MLAQENEQGVEQIVAPCTIDVELLHRVVMRVEELAEPSGRFLVEVIGMEDGVCGEDAFDKVEATPLLIIAGIDAEAELDDESAGEDEVKIGPSRIALLEYCQAGEDVVPETRVGLLLSHRMADEFGHVETLRRLVGMAEGEHIGRLHDLCFAYGPYIVGGISLEHQVEHGHGCHHRSQTVGTFAFRSQGDTTRHPTILLGVEMNELRMVVDGYCGEYNGLCLIGFVGHYENAAAKFVSFDCQICVQI